MWFIHNLKTRMITAWFDTEREAEAYLEAHAFDRIATENDEYWMKEDERYEIVLLVEA